MFKTVSIPLSILAVALTTLSASAFDKPDLTPAELAALNSGEAIISVWKDREADHKPTVTKGGIDIMASTADILALVKECDPVNRYSKDIQDCQILDMGEDTNGEWDIRKEKFAVSPVIPKFKATFRTDYTSDAQNNHVATITRISGSLKVQEGRWDIISLGPNRSRVVYQAAIKPKLPIPGKTIRKQVSIGIPEILHNLRTVAESDFAARMQNIAPLNQIAQNETSDM